MTGFTSRLVRLYAWIIPPEIREAFLGDLEEGYRARLGESKWGARWWYLRQVIRSASPLLCFRGRFRPGPASASLTTGQTMELFLHDLRLALRSFARTPLFTGITVTTLALGIGTATAIFSVVNPILFRSPPFPAADRIALVWERGENGENSNVGYPTFTDLERDAGSFERMAALSFWSAVMSQGGEPELIPGQAVTHEYFRLLGVTPFLGRDFSPEDDIRGQHHVVILSHGIWQRRFGADSGVVGHSVDFGGTPYQVIGVLPSGFESLLSPRAEMWRPLAYNDTLPWACRTCRHLRAVARLKPDVNYRQASGELDLLARRYVADHPSDYSNGTGLGLVPLHDQIVEDVRQPLLVVLGAVLFVFLIACANVANLLLGRMVSRQGEFALRSALGASRRRLAGQVIGESSLLAALGGLGGILVAFLGVKVLLAMSPAGIPRLSAIHLDTAALAFALLMAVVTALACSAVPIFALVRGSLRDRVAQGSRTYAIRGRHWTRRSLVIAEFALALVLLAGAGLLIRSLGQLLKVEAGFETRDLVTLQLIPTGPQFDSVAVVHRVADEILAAVQELPGVTSAGFTSQIPLGGNSDRYGVAVESRPLPNPEDAPAADRFSVTPRYLETLGIPVLAGRGFTAADDSGSVPVALVNQQLATMVWGQESPLGDRVRIGGPDMPWRTVVGVVGDVHHINLSDPVGPQLYLVQDQWSDRDELQMVIRSAIPPATLVPQLRAAIRGVNPGLGLGSIATMDELIRVTTAERRFAMLLFQLFAGVALVLAGAGIYAVIAGSVAERSREMGIRAAMGATRGGLIRLVVSEGMRLAGVGLVLGAVGAAQLARWLRSLLYGVGPGDPVTFVAVAMLLALVAVMACLVPAWRAARADPMEALRNN